MANKQLVIQKQERDQGAASFFDLILIDGGASYTAFVRENSTGGVPALASQVNSVGAIPIIAPTGAGDVTGLGTTNQVTKWTDGPNSVLGDSGITDLPNSAANGGGSLIGVNLTTPAVIAHIVSPQPPAVGTTPGTPALIGLQVNNGAGQGTGGDTTIATTGVGGTGAAVNIRSGEGGQATAAAISSTGGAGGLFQLTSRKGGDASVAGTGSNTGGAGGALNIGTLGAGGAANGATSGANQGGNGGAFNVTGGVGGAASNGGTNTGGTGGNISLNAGVGGAGDTAGAGGSLNLNGGTGGAGVTTGGNGGNVNIAGGNASGAGNRSGGNINITPGLQANSGSRGALVLAGANAVMQFNGPVVAPSAGADRTFLFSADAAAGDNNLYALNEAGKNERLTGLMARVNTQFDSTNQTPANVTGLTFNVEAAKFYSFEAVLFTTSDVAGGVKVTIGGTATATAIIFEILVMNAAVIALQSRQTALAASGGVTAVTAALIYIKGTIQVNAAGTLTVQLSRNAAAGTTSALVGSYFHLLPQGS